MGRKDVSVRKFGMVISVKVSECHGDNMKLFEGEARIGSQKELDRLFGALEDKGLISRKQICGGGWWE